MKNRLYALIGVATFIHILIFIRTPPRARAADLEGHLDHIHYMTTDQSIPSSGECWECFQPPLYYALAGLAVEAIQPASDDAQERWLQAISLVIFLGFMAVGVKILQLHFMDPGRLATASFIFLFWPSGFLHALRIGNDPLFYFFQLAGFYYLCRWDFSAKKKGDLYKSCALAALALFTKANAVILIGVIALAAGGSLWIHPAPSSRVVRPEIKAMAFLTAMLVLFVGLAQFKKGMTSNYEQLITRNHGAMLDWGTFFSFSFKNYFFHPFAVLDAENGWQYFWALLLKSSLYGFVQLTDPRWVRLAGIINGTLLIVVAVIMAGLIDSLIQHRYRLHVLFVAVSLMTLVLYRIVVPHPAVGSFRFIFPVLPSLAIFFTEGIEWLKEKGSAGLAWMGRGAAIATCLIGTYLLFM